MNHVLSVPVSAIMTTRIEMVAETTPLSFAARLMIDKQVTGLPVTTEEGTLVGVLSWSDVVRALGQAPHRGAHRETRSPRESQCSHEAASSAEGTTGNDYYDGLAPTMWLGVLAPLDAMVGTVSEVMSRLIIAVSVDATVRDAARRMAQGNVHRVLVVDERGSLAGIVSAIDIVRLVADSA